MHGFYNIFYIEWICLNMWMAFLMFKYHLCNMPQFAAVITLFINGSILKIENNEIILYFAIFISESAN